MKTIFKNLWNRRRGNAWLFIELALVTVLTWVIADPVVVSIADTSLPLGYDADRLVVVSFSSLTDEAPGYDARYDSVADNERAVNAVMAKLRGNAAVERACNMFDLALIGDNSISINSYESGNPAVDTVIGQVNEIAYPAGEEFFETFGIKVVEGGMSAEELSRRESSPGTEVIITRDCGEVFWPGENALGKGFLTYRNHSFTDEETGDTLWNRVVGVVEGVRWQSMIRTACAAFETPGRWFHKYPATDFNVVVRLREGADMDKYISELRASAPSEFRIGNFYLNTASPYSEMLYRTEDSYGVHSQRVLNYVLAGFFLINLVLGTVGCFWLQTRKRVEEIGIRRSFGARRRSIVGMLVGESVTLATLAFVVGDLIHLQWALHHGLDNGAGNNSIYNLIPNWVSDFAEHFLVLSAIVYAVIIVSVVIGTLIPAVKAARISVTEAVRMNDE